MFGKNMWGTVMWGASGATAFALAAACRLYIVPVENRFFTIEYENRFFTVLAESRRARPLCNTNEEA
jgi:hypothetical protein